MTAKTTLLEIAKNFTLLSSQSSEKINEASDLIIERLKYGNKIMFCGNGGSAADSQHLAAELIGRYRINRRPLSAVALTTDTSTITAIANDFSFDEIFTRQIEAIGKEGDVLYATSTSGKSRNILSAIKIAKSLNIRVIGITGDYSDDMIKYCDIIINVPANRRDRIQEMHIAVGQIICESIESSLC